jgi:hypothetical protein
MLTLKPKYEESLHSYLTRLANLHGLTAFEFNQILWKRTQLNLHPIQPDTAIRRIATSTDLPRDTIYRLTFGEIDSILSTSEKRRRGDYLVFSNCQVCPVCLREPIIYLRKYWRLASVTECPIHGISMIDVCQRCNTRLNLKSGFGRNAFKCGACNFNIGESKVTVSDGPILSFQSHFLNQLREIEVGQVKGGAKLEYVALVRSLVRLYAHVESKTAGSDFNRIYSDRNKMEILSQQVKDEIDRYGIEIRLEREERRAEARTKGTPKWIEVVPLEQTRLEQRQLTVRTVLTWLKDWPTTFRQWARQHSITHNFIDGLGPWPNILDTEISLLPGIVYPKGVIRRRPLSKSRLRHKFGDTREYREELAQLMLRRALNVSEIR